MFGKDNCLYFASAFEKEVIVLTVTDKREEARVAEEIRGRKVIADRLIVSRGVEKMFLKKTSETFGE